MIPGAASHIALTGGWLARKSPPYTVSSKCSQVESPSPLVLTAPLMPPCAHTECERRQGTNENTSTSCPASASLMMAASPARPPPTTMKRCLAISGPDGDEREQRVQSEQDEDHADPGAQIGGQLLRARPDRDPPVDEKPPEPVGEMKARAEDADDVEDPGRHPEEALVQVAVHVIVGNQPLRLREALRLEHRAEARHPHVIRDVDDEYRAGDSLEQEAPVGAICISRRVVARLPGDQQAVGRVIDD